MANKIGLFASLVLFWGCFRPAMLLVGPANVASKNVRISSSNQGYPPCEPSICIDPSHPDRIIAGAILDYLYTSEDGGITWKESRLKSPYGVYGDPIIRVSRDGTVYYTHLSNPGGMPFTSKEFLDRIVIQKSVDGGHTFDDGSFPPGDFDKDHDKQNLYIDPKTGKLVLTWTEFDKYGSSEPTDHSKILFSISEDQGSTWSPPVDISDVDGDCVDDDFTTEGAVSVMDDEGNIYVVWSFANEIWMDKSSDGGKTWLQNDVKIADQYNGWALDIPGILRCNGMPSIGIDRSGGRYDGTLYVNWSDQKNGDDDTDIWLSKSTDGGKTWSGRIKVNDDPPGHHQFFSWMAVDPVTGYIYIVFYDRRDHDDDTTDVYLAYSTDGGKKFLNIKISESPFLPTSNVFFGDYNDISAYNGHVRPIWTRLHKGELSVWTALIDVAK